MSDWKLEDAKNRFSEVVRRAASLGPQFITKHGREAAVVLGVEEYRRLTQPESLLEFLSDSPLADALRSGELEMERRTDPGRDIDLS
jgi:prevent-host-death family protein